MAVPTAVQPTNTPVFPTAVLQPNLAPVADISVNTTPDEANVMESHSETSEIQTRSLDCNKETSEDLQGCVISHTGAAESETHPADLCPTECQIQASDTNHVEKSKGLMRRRSQEKGKSLDEKKQQEQKTDDSLTVKRISRFQVSIVQEDMSVAGEFHCVSWLLLFICTDQVSDLFKV